MEEKFKSDKNKYLWSRRIVNTSVASWGWKIALIGKDNSVTYIPIVCWATVEEKCLSEASEPDISFVVAMIPGDFGILTCVDEIEGDFIISPPGTNVEFLKNRMTVKPDRNVS